MFCKSPVSCVQQSLLINREGREASRIYSGYNAYRGNNYHQCTIARGLAGFLLPGGLAGLELRLSKLLSGGGGEDGPGRLFYLHSPALSLAHKDHPENHPMGTKPGGHLGWKTFGHLCGAQLSFPGAGKRGRFDQPGEIQRSAFLAVPNRIRSIQAASPDPATPPGNQASGRVAVRRRRCRLSRNRPAQSTQNSQLSLRQ